MEQDKRYYAFISYKREDERWAKWLQHRLEHYKLPSNLNGRTDLPREIRPVFRDTAELNPGNLPQQIHDALTTSRHLIVVCSPRTAASPWVNREIEAFIAMGKQDRIIPFIVDGRPMADDPGEECFPQAIRDLPKEQELLGANVNEMGRDAAAVKTVAQMFGVRFDTLWKRYEREQKRKRAMVVAAVALFVLAVLTVAGVILRQNTVINKSRADLQVAYDNLSAANRKTEAERARAEHERDRAEQERNYANQERSRAEKAEDSIRVQYSIIEQANDDLRRTNDARAQAQSRAAAEAAKRLLEKGDSYGAWRLSAAAMDIFHTPEAEFVMRSASESVNVSISHETKVKYASFCLNGQIFSVSEKKNDGVYDLFGMSNPKSGKVVAEIGDEMRGTRFCSNNERKKYVAQELGFIGLIDVEKKQAINNHIVSLSLIESIDLSPDSKKIIIAHAKGIAFLDASTLKIVDMIKTAGWIRNAKYSKDGRRIYAAQDSLILVWDVQTKTCLDTLKGHRKVVADIEISPQGDMMISTAVDSTYCLWNIADGKGRIKGKGRGKKFGHMAISPDGKYLAASIAEDNIITIWNIKTGKQVRTLSGHKKAINSIEYSSNGEKIISSSDDGTVMVWDLSENQIDELLKGGEIGAIHPNGEVIAVVDGLYNNRIKIYDFQKKKQVKSLEGHSDIITHIGFSSDGEQIVTSSLDSTVRIWNTATGKCNRKITGIKGDVYYAVLAPDNKRILIVAQDTVVYNEYIRKERLVCSIRLYDINNSEVLHTFPWETNKWRRLNVSFNSEKKIVALAAFGSINVVDLQTYRRKQLLEHDGDITAVKIEEGGNIIASSSKDKTVRLWNAETGECMKMLSHESSVSSVSFSHNGKYIVTTSEDQSVRIWNVSSGRCMLETHLQMPVQDAVFAENDRSVVAIETNAIRIIDFPPLEELIKETRERFKDNPLTAEERRKYYLE